MVTQAYLQSSFGKTSFRAGIQTLPWGESMLAPITDSFRPGPGYKWGYGLLLNTHDIPGMRRAGSGAWAGLLNTHFWVDPSAGVTGAIYTQFLPFVTPEAYQVYVDFEKALYAIQPNFPAGTRSLAIPMKRSSAC